MYLSLSPKILIKINIQVTLRLAKILIRLKKKRKKDKLPVPWIAVMLLRKEWSDHFRTCPCKLQRSLWFQWFVFQPHSQRTKSNSCSLKGQLHQDTNNAPRVPHERKPPPVFKGLKVTAGGEHEQSTKNCTWTGIGGCEQLHVSYGMKGDSVPLMASNCGTL